MFFFPFFLIYKRRVGIGEDWHEVDFYLLDNRNRTQKWDEYGVRFWPSEFR